MDNTGPNGLPAGNPFLNIDSNPATNLYWSSTTSSGTLGGDGAYLIYLGSASVTASGPKFTAFHFWCVRGGQGVDVQ